MASKLARGAVVSVLGQWTKYVVQVAAVVVYSHLLAPGQVGLVTMATAVTGVAWVLGDFGLSLAALQADELTAQQQTQLFWSNSTLGLVVAAVTTALSPVIAVLYGEHRLVPIIAVSSISFLLAGLTAQFSVAINRAGRYAVLAGIDVASQVAGLTVGIVVIALGGGYWGLVASPITVSAVGLVGAAARAGWWPGLPRRGTPMGGLYRFGGQTLGLHLATYVATNVDSIAIGRVLGAAPLGFYNRAYQLAAVPVLQIASPLTRVMLPGLSARRNDLAAYALLTRRIQILMCYGLGGVLSLLAVEAGQAVPIVLGGGWGSAVAPLRLLCLAGTFEAAGYIYYWLMLSRSRTGTLFWVESGPRVVSIVLVIAFVHHGIAWVAAALAIGQVLMWAVASWVVPPVARLHRGSVLVVSGRALVALAWVTGASAVVDSRVHLPHLAAAVVVGMAWLAAFALATAVPPVRRDLRELVGIRGALRRTPEPVVQP